MRTGARPVISPTYSAGRPAVQTGEYLADRNPRGLQSGVDAQRGVATDRVKVALGGAVGEVVAMFDLHAAFYDLLLPMGMAVTEVDDVAALRQGAHQFRCAAVTRHTLSERAACA